MPPWSKFPAYVSAAEKKARAAAEIVRLTKLASGTGAGKGKGKGKAGAGRAPEPVVITGKGRQLTTTFWGQAWCNNLEAYADFAHRLQRGRSYARSGAVVDLHIEGGEVRALVSGSELYRIEIAVDALPAARWKSIVRACAGQIGSLVGLLRGELPDQVMQLVTDPERGLFPDPDHLTLSCSCPDRASVCKHVAASLYGVGARLDSRPELLFLLRGVNPQDLTEQAVKGIGATAPPAGSAAPVLAADPALLSELFGIELATTPAPLEPSENSAPPATPPRAGRKRR